MGPSEILIRLLFRRHSYVCSRRAERRRRTPLPISKAGFLSSSPALTVLSKSSSPDLKRREFQRRGRRSRFNCNWRRCGIDRRHALPSNSASVSLVARGSACGIGDARLLGLPTPGFGSKFNPDRSRRRGGTYGARPKRVPAGHKMADVQLEGPRNRVSERRKI